MTHQTPANTPNLHYIVNVEGAVFHEGRYLLAVRGAGETHAAGLLSLIGGKVEGETNTPDVLEKTLIREIAEEVGITAGDLYYLHSVAFTADDGDICVDVIFLARWISGEAAVNDLDEVASVEWMTADQVRQHPAVPPWTLDSIERAERMRLSLGW
jgi:8-oxo-dGTP diphosphatase